MDYLSYKQGREKLVELIKLQSKIVAEACYDTVANISEKPSETLRRSKEGLEQGDLNTLVMGRFSTGKSVFLNALMGASLLPSDVRPCTAVIGEITYGEDWDVTLYARDSKLEPVKIALKDLQQYITIPHGTTPCVEQNKYSKVKIAAPIQVFQQGVSFVDSPGLDDPTSHDAVTTSYLPKADAIVYVMNCQNVYARSDKDMIEELRILGHTSIMFVITFFDVLETNDSMYGTDDAEKCRMHCLETLAPLTDLGESGIFFVNSRAALKAKIDHNQTLLEKSHFPRMEHRLEQILAEEKGRIKLRKIYTDVCDVNSKCGAYVSSFMSISAQEHEKLKNKVKLLRVPLQNAEKRADEIYQILETESATVRKNVVRLADEYYKELVEKVGQWMRNEKETPCENQIKMLDLKESVEKFITELNGQVKLRIQSDIRKWSDDKLSSLIDGYVQSLSALVDKELKVCLDMVNEVKFTLNDCSEKDFDATPSNSERVIAAGIALMLGDIYGATMGGIGGIGGMLRTFTCEVVAAVALFAVSMFTPVGWGVWIGSMISAAIGGGVWTKIAMNSRIRDMAAQKALEDLSKEEAIDSFRDGMIVAEIRKGLGKELSEPINQAKKMLEDAERVYSAKSSEIAKQQVKFKSLMADSLSVSASLEEFAKTYLK